MALGQDFHRVLPLSSVSIIPPQFSIIMHQLGGEQYAHSLPQLRHILAPATLTLTTTTPTMYSNLGEREIVEIRIYVQKCRR
jgi:hypothetical protein